MELNIDVHMKITHYLYFWLYTKMLGMYIVLKASSNHGVKG